MRDRISQSVVALSFAGRAARASFLPSSASGPRRICLVSSSRGQQGKAAPAARAIIDCPSDAEREDSFRRENAGRPERVGL
ncbi:hypothetical protein MTO96_013032 [Rhipicephalus appendiculatus]